MAKTEETLGCEPVVSTHAIEIEEVDCCGSMNTGFRMDWIEAKTEEVEINLTCGAGCGSPWMQIRVEEAGKPPRYFRSDMRKFLSQFIDTVLN